MNDDWMDWENVSWDKPGISQIQEYTRPAEEQTAAQCQLSTIASLITSELGVKPTVLQTWAWQCILASYPNEPPVLYQVWGGALEYIGWLESLPVTGHAA